MKMNKKIGIIIATVLILLIGGGVVYATNSPTARAERQLNLGTKYLGEGKYQEAILAFQKVIEIEPKNIPARMGLGKVYVATKDYEKAKTVLEEVIQIDANNIPAREDLFDVLIKQDKLDEANAVLQEITKLNPSVDIAQFNSKIDIAKSIKASKASYDQGVTQMNNKQYPEAIDSFQKVIKEDTERYDDAQTKITESKKLFIDTTLPKSKDAASQNDYQTALSLIDQALKVDPNNQDALKLKTDYEKAIADQNSAKERNRADFLNLAGKGILPGAQYGIGTPISTIKSQLGEPLRKDTYEGSFYYQYDNVTYFFIASSQDPGVILISVFGQGAEPYGIKLGTTPLSQIPSILGPSTSGLFYNEEDQVYELSYQIENYYVEFSASSEDAPTKSCSLIRK